MKINGCKALFKTYNDAFISLANKNGVRQSAILQCLLSLTGIRTTRQKPA
jgi:hypothetical protein